MSGFTSNWSIYQILSHKKQKKQKALTEEIKERLDCIEKAFSE